MRIKNINDMTAKACPCGSWLDHWKNTSRQPLPSVCPAKGCAQLPDAGAFVQKDNYLDDGWYIVPLCPKHNRLFGASLDLNDGVALVLAQPTRACGQPSAHDRDQADYSGDLAPAPGV
jgi:hypothetical protein